MRRLLVANRAEISCRIIRTARELGFTTLSLYTEIDSELPHRYSADESFLIDSYSSAESVLQIAKSAKANFLHPGYGFLSEQSKFVTMLEASGVKFVGPPGFAIDAVGDKAKALELALLQGIPTAKGIRLPLPKGENYEEIVEAVATYAKTNPFPLLLKARAGGGGRGMRVVNSNADINAAVSSASREALLSFGDASLIVERKIINARHIEAQVIADSHGSVMVLGDRDCSLQRNHQKVIEEAPAPFLKDKTRSEIHGYAKRLLEAARYVNAGTVEFLVNDKEEIFFLEVNPRLQVEHPVTEMTSGFDLVELQLKIAEGAKLSEITKERKKRSFGHAVEARICAEEFFPEHRISTGKILAIEVSKDVRADFGYQVGNQVTHLYDSLLGKIIVGGNSREEVFEKLKEVLLSQFVFGVKTSGEILSQVLSRFNTKELFLIDNPLTNYCKPRSDQETLTLALAWGVAYHLATHQGNPFLEERLFRLGGSETIENKILVDNVPVVLILQKEFNKFLFRAEIESLAQTLSIEEFSYKETSNFTNINYSDGEINALHTAKGSWVHTKGLTAFVTKQITKRAGSKNSQSGITEVKSHLPGKLLKHLVAVGDEVQVGTGLAVLESMKMENIIKAQTAGKVSKWLVQPGQVVAADEALLQITS